MRIEYFISALFISLAIVVNPSPAQIPTSVVLKPVFAGQISFTRPVYFNEMPGKPEHYIILESHLGRVSLAHRENNQWVKKEFLRISINSSQPEMGLLGFAFHPDFKTNRKYYLNYNPTGKLATVIEERVADVTFLKDSGQPGRTIMEFDQPYGNHNGGSLEFGPDGFLYIGTGDGGSGGDPQNRAQNLNVILGKMLRINVNSKDPGKEYAVPKDNPFIGVDNTRPEIWAYGLRNPWKYSFDSETQELLIGDVGQRHREEITLAKKGENLGWKIREGNTCFNPNNATSPLNTCNFNGMREPIVSLPRSEAESITGGYVFRGSPDARFTGVYIFGDYGTRRIWGLTHKDGTLIERVQIGTASGAISSFGTDSQGNIYVVTFNGIFKLEHAELRPAATSARKTNAPFGMGKFQVVKNAAGTYSVSFPSPSHESFDFHLFRTDGTLAMKKNSVRTSRKIELLVKPGMYIARIKAGGAINSQTLYLD